MPPLKRIERIAYAPPRRDAPDIEALEMAELRQRASPKNLARPKRADFRQMLGVVSGACVQTVDFTEVELAVGDWLLIDEGQVHRHDVAADWQGWLIVFRPEMAEPGLWAGLAPKRSLAPSRHAALCALAAQMAEDMQAPASLPARNRALAAQLNAALARLALWEPTAASGAKATDPRMARFRALLEADFARRQEVGHYADKLAISAKTLNRLCLSQEGQTAKALIARRVMLEAKRWLAHTARPVHAIGLDLGFQEATNFSKFFRRHAGVTPLAFRRAQQRG